MGRSRQAGRIQIGMRIRQVLIVEKCGGREMYQKPIEEASVQVALCFSISTVRHHV